jgi:hypothetical protein
MNNFDWFIRCPVQREQRPFYEYLKRKESIILGWVALNQFKYARRFCVALLFFFIIFFPFSSWLIPFKYYPLQSVLGNLLASFIGLGLLYLYFFIAWFYAGKRLVEAKVWYEESGWYDGRIWIKPPSILKHERLLYHYQLVPLVKRLKNTLRIITLNIGLLALILFFLFY